MPSLTSHTPVDRKTESGSTGSTSKTEGGSKKIVVEGDVDDQDKLMALRASIWRQQQRKMDDDHEDNNNEGNAVPQTSYDMLDNDEEKLWVKFEGQSEPTAIGRYLWKHCLIDAERNLPEDQWTEFIQLSQYPLMPAYASTIHKTQSLTLTAAVLNLGPEAATPGKAYTALSRIESLDGVFIQQLVPNAFVADPVIKCYYQLLLEISPPL
jgi:hypothetical protein